MSPDSQLRTASSFDFRWPALNLFGQFRTSSKPSPTPPQSATTIPNNSIALFLRSAPALDDGFRFLSASSLPAPILSAPALASAPARAALKHEQPSSTSAPCPRPATATTPCLPEAPGLPPFGPDFAPMPTHGGPSSIPTASSSRLCPSFLWIPQTLPRLLGSHFGRFQTDPIPASPVSVFVSFPAGSSFSRIGLLLPVSASAFRLGLPLGRRKKHSGNTLLAKPPTALFSRHISSFLSFLTLKPQTTV